MISLSYKNSGDFTAKKISAVNFNPPPWSLEGRGILFSGSCFAEYLFQELHTADLNVQITPFGNIYNPAAMETACAMVLESGEVRPSDFVERDGIYYHYMFHSLVYGEDPGIFRGMLNRALEQSRRFLRDAEALILTAGTAAVYRLRESGMIVNNCHKQPASAFSREILSPDQASKHMIGIIEKIRAVNPDIRIIWTLSPVRHLRDNPAENSLSKAVLRCAIDEAVKSDPEGSWYFPSYEIMMDELRDYRWYADDLCHPSREAVEYILSRFINAVYSPRYREFLTYYTKLLKSLNHRPLNPDSESYIEHIRQTEEKIEEIKLKNTLYFSNHESR